MAYLHPGSGENSNVAADDVRLVPSTTNFEGVQHPCILQLGKHHCWHELPCMEAALEYGFAAGGGHVRCLEVRQQVLVYAMARFQVWDLSGVDWST